MKNSKHLKTNILKENEEIDDLQINGEKIIQMKEGFRYGIDAVLLSNFVKIKNKNQKLIDFGTGNGIIPLIIAAKSDIMEIHGIEIQEKIADMAARSVILNDFQDRIKIHNMDIKNIKQHFNKESFDIVTANPPYMPGEKLQAENDMIRISRNEVLVNLENIMENASYLLKSRAKMYMVHRPSRLAEIFYKAKKYLLEPKKVIMVHPRLNKAPNMVLIEFMKNGREEIKFYPPLYIHEEDGKYQEKIIKIYSSKTLKSDLYSL